MIALDRVVEMMDDAHSLTVEAQDFIWAKEVKDPQTGEIFEIEGWDRDGALKLRQGSYKTVWNRWG